MKIRIRKLIDKKKEIGKRKKRNMLMIINEIRNEMRRDDKVEEINICKCR